MLAVLRRMTPAMFTELPEVSEGLEYRIASAAQEAVSLLESLRKENEFLINLAGYLAGRRK